MHQGNYVDIAQTRRAGSSLAWLLGPIATGLGWAAHVAGGGQSPAVLIVLALAALLGMAASILGRRQLPTWAVMVAAALAQQLLHFAFSAFASASGFSLPGHGHGPAPAPDAVSAADPVPAQPAASHDLHLLLYVHAGAALLTAFLAVQWGRIVRLRRPASESGQRSLALRRERAADDADA